MTERILSRPEAPAGPVRATGLRITAVPASGMSVVPHKRWRRHGATGIFDPGPQGEWAKGRTLNGGALGRLARQKTADRPGRHRIGMHRRCRPPKRLSPLHNAPGRVGQRTGHRPAGWPDIRASQTQGHQNLRPSSGSCRPARRGFTARPVNRHSSRHAAAWPRCDPGPTVQAHQQSFPSGDTTVTARSPHDACRSDHVGAWIASSGMLPPPPPVQWFQVGTTPTVMPPHT